MDTIYALSSGHPPAAIAVIRISGPQARAAATALAGTLPADRTAGLRTLRSGDGEILDRALVLAFPGPATSTGEDLVELHLHGGRAVVAAVSAALSTQQGLRPAVAGEFTRRALTHGRIDLTQAQGLADLLEAETEAQRRAALAAAEGAVGRAIAGWMETATQLAARVEAALDFSDEADLEASGTADIGADARRLAASMAEQLDRPSVERLRDGFVVVLAGPRNAGKSSLFNALLQRDAAIVTPIAGTTRDILEATVVRAGIPYRLLDTAGLAEQTHDPVEAIGIARAASAMGTADIILWLGAAADAPKGAIRVHSRMDVTGREVVPEDSIGISAHDAKTVDHLWSLIAQTVTPLVVVTDRAYLREEQRRVVRDAAADVTFAAEATDDVLAAEHLRLARRGLASLLGHDATETMLDALFARFCIGK
jgi:tRNA modification GTPase